MLLQRASPSGMSAVSDEDRSRRASDERFDRLWQEHRPRIWRLVARLAGSADLADDLTQEVSLRAFQAFGDFRGEARFFAAAGIATQRFGALRAGLKSPAGASRH